jgi:hypothetical protein
VAFLVDVICVTASVSRGFGRDVLAVHPENLALIQILGNVSMSSGILAAVWSKTSFGITLLRITSEKTKLAVWFIIISMNLLMTLHGLMPWIQCYPASKSWNGNKPGRCWDARVNVYYGVTAAGILIPPAQK